VPAVERVVTRTTGDHAAAVTAADQVVTAASVDRIVAVAAEDHIGTRSGGADVDNLGLVGANDDSDVDRARKRSVTHRDSEIRERYAALHQGFDPQCTVGPAAAEDDVAKWHHRWVRRGSAQRQAG